LRSVRTYVCLVIKIGIPMANKQEQFITDEQWQKLEPLLPKYKRSPKGGPHRRGKRPSPTAVLPRQKKGTMRRKDQTKVRGVEGSFLGFQYLIASNSDFTYFRGSSILCSSLLHIHLCKHTIEGEFHSARNLLLTWARGNA